MAKITAINHIAFAVKDLPAALDNAINVLGGEMMMEFESIEDKYKGACVRFGVSIMSFISSDDPDSFISQFVAKHGNGIQHIGLEIDNIEEYVAELEAKGDAGSTRPKWPTRITRRRLRAPRPATAWYCS